MANNFNTITAFKDAFNGGTRANRFRVYGDWPANMGFTPTTNDTNFKIVSASLPVAQINSISIPYRGRMINFAGDRQYTPWTIGIYDDGNTNNLWRSFQRWKEMMDGHKTHTVITQNNNFSYSQYQKTWTLEQLGINGGNDVIRRIYLYKCWPSVVGEINLNLGESNFVAFNVQLTFDYFKIQTGLTRENFD